MTVFYEWEKRVGGAAIFEVPHQMSNREVTLSDDTVFSLIDAGLEDTCFVFQNGRWVCRTDDWLEVESIDGMRTMRLSMMDRI